jgi:hypothetical protein
VGTDTTSNDELYEPAIEMSRTRTKYPDVSLAAVAKALIPAAVLIMAVLWMNVSHIFGLFRNQGAHVKGAKVALVDFDGGNFGEALRMAAATNNQTHGYPTYVNVDTLGLTPEGIRHKVFEGKYWAAIVVQPGASTRFEAALNGTSNSYDATDVYTYYLMTARYYTLYVSGIQSTTATTASIAAGLFSRQFVSAQIASGSFANTTTAANALASPAQPMSLSAASQDLTTMDDKPFLNTLGAVLPVLMQFFFIMALNGIANGMHLYAAKTLRQQILLRLFWSTVWPIFASLCSAGWTFAFRGSYKLDAKIFFAYWAVTWVYCMISFDVLDIITGFIPMPFVPFFMVTWIFCNVTAALGSPELVHHWYRVSYFFPALHWYQIFITIISEGGVNRLHYTLPVLAAWLLVGKAVSPLATRYRANKAKEVYKTLKEKDALDLPH